MVPWLRICGVATLCAASARSPNRPTISAFVSISVSEVIAPISRPSVLELMPFSSPIAPRSMTAAGFLMRSLNQSKLSKAAGQDPRIVSVPIE